MSRRKNIRRAFGRCQVEFPVGFWSLTNDHAPVEYMKGRTIDLSEGGLLFRCECFEDGFLEELARDDARFAMRIHLAGSSDWVRAIAKVVFIEEADGDLMVRACFVKLDEDSKAKIRAVVEQGAVDRSTIR